MNRRIVLLLSAGALVLGACGGESASSDVADVTSGSAVAETTSAPEDSSTTQAVAATSAPTSPADVLVDLSYDIEGIDGPVVLWFWAPG